MVGMYQTVQIIMYSSILQTFNVSWTLVTKSDLSWNLWR